ncbi:MAG: AAC(3) family N-acetyltransferase [Thermoplasmata archaeon]
MTEADVVARTRSLPSTHATLKRDLQSLGVTAGSTILVHSSLSSLGWVVGGPQAVIGALEDAVGTGGTLMMPAFSESAPEPSRWRNPPVPESWWPIIRNEWSPYDPAWTPSRGLGVIAELFRTQPGTLRSLHPNDSFAARGPGAQELLRTQTLDFGLGENSPLARLFDVGGWVLLLGVDHGSNTSMHLAEHRAEWPGRAAVFDWAGRVVRDGRIEAVRLRDIDGTSDDFSALGADYELAGGVVQLGTVGMATARLMRQRPLVDYAVGWIERHRRRSPG